MPKLLAVPVVMNSLAVITGNLAGCGLVHGSCEEGCEIAKIWVVDFGVSRLGQDQI